MQSLRGKFSFKKGQDFTQWVLKERCDLLNGITALEKTCSVYSPKSTLSILDSCRYKVSIVLYCDFVQTQTSQVNSEEKGMKIL